MEMTRKNRIGLSLGSAGLVLAVVTIRLPAADAQAGGPEQLVREYVQRDAHGERLRTAPWFLDVVTWPEESAFDSYVVISGFDVGPAASDADSARMEVTYQRVGWIETRGPSSVRFIEGVDEERHEFVVVRRHRKWLIAAPRLGPRVLGDSVLVKAPLSPEDEESIRSLLRNASG